ncbi:hypothetical protein [Parafrankia sp. EUN1f]|uniref:hypothetical protein n=1 Tax=Parafrankia sp. EUN1f TaxID=102897 RepID=UPI0001C45108|nr:hypothetical protein [Parafrankia sp. EUN1f]EFC85196.1 hypothetical protein FrEUN1fDRAFT_1649 [Parafrankia sp. EUN1f]
MRKFVPLLATTVAVFAVVSAAPALADTTGNTSATVTLSTTGVLSITVPAAIALSGSVADTTLNGQLGNVQVTDERSADPAAWNASVSATPFTSGTHALGSAAYDPGVVTTTGIPASQITTNIVTLSTSPQVTVTLDGGTSFSGNNTAVWDPSISVPIPAGSVTGTYTSTITHSVV